MLFHRDSKTFTFQYISTKYPQDDIYYPGILLKFIPTSEKKKRANGEEYACTPVLESPLKNSLAVLHVFSTKSDKSNFFFFFVLSLIFKVLLKPWITVDVH